MSFRLGTVFYVFALLAAALATFGPALGLCAAGIVLGFWAWWIYRSRRNGIWADVIAAVLICVGIFTLLLPTVSSRPGGPRSDCQNNLKQIALALLNHESARRLFPPAHIADVAGKPMHSWRVLILPYLGEVALFQKYNMNEPWDGPNNSQLAASMPDVYRCPSHEDHSSQDQSETNYLVVAGPETIFPTAAPGRAIRSITDGTSRTIAVIEASGLGIHWMEPRDVTIDEAVELLTKTPRSGHQHIVDGFLTTTHHDSPQRNVAFCDGHVEWIGQLGNAEIARALLTAAGGEPISQDWNMQFVEPKTTTVVKWGKVWGLAVFVLLAALPAWMRRAEKTSAVEGEEQGVGDVG